MKIAVLFAGLLIAASLAWFASEQHYDNCIDTARAEFPLGQAGLTAKDRRAEPNWMDEYDGDPGNVEDKGAAIRDRPLRRRQAALKDCSRLPW